MNEVKITYYKKNEDDRFIHLKIEGSLIIGDSMFSSMIGVKNEEGFILIPINTVTMIEAKELDEMFLTPLEIFGKIKAESLEREEQNLGQGMNKNHLFG
tara:strand:- start:123 stop:419 length:297 start_codon:yes stop_codon:yes gene_type:complete